MSFLQVTGLRKSYGVVTALDGIDLSVPAISRTAIVGPSGCGKTTLLRLIAGFEAPDAGRVMLNGERLVDEAHAVPAHQRGIGVVMQDGALFPHLSIADNIGFGLSRNEPDRARRIADLAYTVGLDASILRRRPHQLSGGQQQRVALARAMARKPSLMLLDEPFSALDMGLRASMREAVAELLESAGITTILVTHDQAEALSFADQVAVMREGRFSQVGTPRELYFHPSDSMVAQFLGDAILLPARLARGMADCAIGKVSVEEAGRRDSARIMLRPEQIVLEPVSAAEATAGGTGPAFAYGEVKKSEFAGSYCTVSLRLLNIPDAPAAAIGATPLVLRRPSVEELALGSFVRIRILGKAHVIA
jgi:iron(III) transport system ATP-binding protein